MTAANIDNDNGSPVGGLAGYNGYTGLISDSLAEAQVSNAAYGYVGGLVGVNGNGVDNGVDSAGIINSHSTGNVSGANYIGGLVGQSRGGHITNTYASGDVTSVDGGYAGGLVGDMGYGNVSGSFATGNVSSPRSAFAGGLIGNASFVHVDHSYATGSVSAAIYAGGLIGFSVAWVSDSYATGNVVAGSRSGGLIGYNSGPVTRSHATGHVAVNDINSVNGDAMGGLIGLGGAGTALTDVWASGDVYAPNIDHVGGSVIGNNFVGGLAGSSDSGHSVINSYALGAVRGNAYVGGLLGHNSSYVSGVYSTGYVSGDPRYTGGLIGFNQDGLVYNAYWNTLTSGQSRGGGYINDVGQGLTTSQLQGSLPSGFDLGVWGTDAGLYPYLKAFGTVTTSQKVSGFTRQSDGATAVAGGAVDLFTSGSRLGSTSTGADGYYYFVAPAGAVSDTTSLGGTITPYSASSPTGASFTDTPQPNSGDGVHLNMNSGIFAKSTSKSTYSSLISDLSATFGANLYPALVSNASITKTNIMSSGAFMIDSALSTDDTLVIEARGGDLIIGAAGSVTSSAAGDAIVLAANGAFKNLGTASAVIASNGRWLISTTTPASSNADVTGGLIGKNYYGDTYSFGMDNSVGAFAFAPNAGNRFVHGYQATLTIAADTKSVTYDGQIKTDTYAYSGLLASDSFGDAAGAIGGLTTPSKNVGSYAITPFAQTASDLNYNVQFQTGVLNITPAPLTLSLIGAVSKVYDSNTTAKLTAANFSTLSGVIAGDTVTVNKPATGAYADKNAGTGKAVTVTGLTLSGASAGNYALAASVTGNVGTITKKTITSSLNGIVSKVYNGTTAAALTASNINLAGVFAGDVVSVTGTGTFASRNVGATMKVAVTKETLSGADAGNYVVSLAPAANIGTITPASLVITAVANTKVYDGSTTAAAAPKVTGLGTGDTITALTESYTDQNAGTGKTLVVNSGFVINDGNGGNNYLTPTLTSVSTGVIAPKALTSTLTGNVTKVYDGTTSAVLGSNNFLLSGVIAGDTVAATGAGTFNNKNVGTAKTITVTTEVLNNSNYIVAKAAPAAIGTITQASLTLTANANTKTYDGTVTAAAAPSIVGLQKGDTVTGLAQVYADKNAATGKTLNIKSGFVVNDGNAGGNYNVTLVSSQTGVINPKTLSATLVGTISKTYDGTANATIAASNFGTLSGVVAGDSVSLIKPTAGLYSDQNAGSGKTVTVTGVGLQGASAANYVLSSTTISAAIGTILKKALTASLTGTVSKVYDGTKTAYLVPANYFLNGVITGDIGLVSTNAPAIGSYATAAKGAGITVTVTGLTLTGAGANNYTLPASTVSGPVGTIH